MANVTLGKRPKPFPRTVSFQMLDGDAAELTLTFKYRTKREFGALVDSLTAAPAQQPTPANGAQQGADHADQLPLLADASQPAVQPAASAQPDESGAGPAKPVALKIPKLEEILLARTEAQADYIMEIAVAWDVPETPFTRENVMQFCDEQPAGVRAVMDAYREAITEGRLGN